MRGSMKVWRIGAAMLTAAIVAGCATADNAYLDRGAAARIKADIAWLADDEREGRKAGTRGYVAAADYVAKEFKAAGLTPGNRGEWRQTVPLRASTRDLGAARMTLDGLGGEQALEHLKDYIIGRSASVERFEASGALVYVGYGVSAPTENYDDYAGLDVAGKVVVAFGGAPRGFPTDIAAYFSDTGSKLKIAAEKGAVGFISLQSRAYSFPWSAAVVYADAPSTSWARPEAAPPGITATATLSETGAKKLFAGEAMDFFALRTAEAASGAPKGFALKKRAYLAGAAKFQDSASANVIGVIEGSDPALKDEVILLTAHLDHIGVDEGGKPGDDLINNGALDNASGIAVLIEAANRFRRLKHAPRRTIAFAALTAEEMGLIGSDYLAHNPVFEGKRVIANVNLDMPVLLYKFTDVVAFGAERSTIGPVVREAAASLDVALSPDPLPEEGLFTRSDHYSFVKQGVPSVFLIIGFGNGGEKIFREFLDTHYHSPTDDLALPILYDQAARFTELNYRIARALADADAAPAWNPGDFFGETLGRR